MCLGIPGQIVEFDDDNQDLAVVEVAGVRRRISIALLDDLTIGTWVLIHVGFAMSVIDEAEAAASLALLAELGEGPDDVLGPVR